MTTASKATRQAVRTKLGRNPTAVECVNVAHTMTGMTAEVVVFEGNRVFVATSTDAGAPMQPRPMTAAEVAAAASGGIRTERVEDPTPSVLLPLRSDGVLIAGLSLFGGEELPEITTGLEPLVRLLGGLIAQDPKSETAGFHDKVVNALRECVIILTPDLNLSWASQGAVNLLGLNPLEAVGRPALDFLHPDDVEETLSGIAKFAEGLEMYRVVVRVLNASGSYVPVEVMGTDLTMDPDIGGMVLSLRDGQRDSELGQEIERSRQLSSAIVEGLPDGLIATDRYGHVTMANTVARAMFDADPDVVPAGLPLETFALYTLSGRPVDLLQPTAKPVRCLLPDQGEIRYLDCSIGEIAGGDSGGHGRVIVLTDVTAEHRAAEDLREQALHDQLTGLPNRRQLEARLNLLATGSTPGDVAVCFIDLDGFKLVNDNHGHRVGDQVIRLAAQRLQRQLRDEDLLVRHGGDEFVAVLVDVASLAGAEAVAERLRQVLEAPYEIGNERFDLSASVGVALASTTGLMSELLLQQADIALYEAKGNGRNRVQVFDESLAQVVSDEQQQRRILRDAIDEGRVVMHFQSLVDSLSDRTMGFEALARILTSDGELLTPSHFLDAVAHTSLVWDLDRVAFAQSCDAAQLLAAIDPANPPYVACNFSSASLSHPDFVTFVVETTEAAKVSPDQMCVEVTESAAFESGGRSADALNELQQRGYRLALDDFGTGYSSLAHLRDLPITSVKVDRSFVAQLGAHSSERAIAEAVVTLAHDLGLGIVAEGVETIEQARQVKDMGFQTSQGWHYSKALPIDRCLEHWRTRSVQPQAS